MRITKRELQSLIEEAVSTAKDKKAKELNKELKAFEKTYRALDRELKKLGEPIKEYVNFLPKTIVLGYKGNKKGAALAAADKGDYSKIKSIVITDPLIEQDLFVRDDGKRKGYHAIVLDDEAMDKLAKLSYEWVKTQEERDGIYKEIKKLRNKLEKLKK